jgi:hypothetical protein
LKLVLRFELKLLVWFDLGDWFGWNSKQMELVRFLKCANNKIVWFDFGLVSEPLAELVLRDITRSFGFSSRGKK